MQKGTNAIQMMTMKNILAMLLLTTLVGCKDEPEQIPAYLNLQPFTVNAQGGASWQKLTDGWLYVNGEYLGAYTLPATVPVLAEGASDIVLFPGVKENGIAASPNIYPQLLRWDANDVNLKPGEVTNLQPATAYDPDTKFPFGLTRGDFDGGSSIVIENRDEDVVNSFEITTDGAFAGKCILMELDTAHPSMDIATEIVEGIPVTGAPEVWLELHYKCDVPIFLYLIYADSGSEGTTPVYQFNNSENWNKIYINLTEAITASQADQYRLLFRTIIPKDSAGKYTQLTGTIRLDNIRMTHL